jgi:hypothetical protein
VTGGHENATPRNASNAAETERVPISRTSEEKHMARKWMLLGLLMMLPWGTAAKASDYDPSRCEAFSHNMDPAFVVPGGGQYRLTIDMTHCGGMVQNYQLCLMDAKRGAPYATLRVLDQHGQSVGLSDPKHHAVYIGNVPEDAVYTIVVISGTRRDESCILYYSGAM